MTGPSFDAADLLRQLVQLPPAQRSHAVRTTGPVDEVFVELAAEIEKLALTRVAEAMSASEIILELADEIGGPRARSVARRARSQSLAYSGRYEDALPVCIEAVTLAEEADEPVVAAHARLATVHPLVHLARFDDAISAGEQARAAFLAADEPLFAGRADSSIGGVYQRKDDANAALRHFDRARPLLAENPVLRAQLESNRGLALTSLDDFAGAERAYRSALPAFEQAGMRWAIALVEANLAVLATRQGRLHEALHHFERTQQQLDQDSAPGTRATVLIEHADALVLVGFLEQALKQYRVALPIVRRHGLVREATQAQAGIAGTLAMLGHTAEADEQLTTVIAAYDELNQAAEAARLRLTRAQLALNDDRPADARRMAEQVLCNSAERPAVAAAAYGQLARAALAQQDWPAAERACNAALASVEQLGVAPMKADLLHARGLLHSARGDHEGATADLRVAVELIEQSRGLLQAERFRTAFHHQRLDVYADLAKALLDRGTPASSAEAFHVAEQAKGRSLLEQAQGVADDATSAAGPGRDTPFHAELRGLRAELNALYSRLADAQFGGGTPKATRAWQEKARARERRIQTLESRVAAAEGVVGGLFDRPVDVSTVQARLEPDMALLEYFVIDDELVVFVVRPDAFHVKRGLGGPRGIAEQIQRLHFQLRRALRPGASEGFRADRLLHDVRRELRALHDGLLLPVRETLAGIRRLVIVPHGALHSLCFPALWDGERYLVEDFDITYAPSASMLTGLPALRDDGAALVVGVMDDQAPLIEAEARRVAEAMRTERLLLGSDATALALTEHVGDLRLLHLACHGHFSAATPAASGLRLADRWLTVREIGGLRLRGSLVTLSGCETGRTVVQGGDELLGLVRGFLTAGAAGVVVSLWTVHDESTAELMTAFYNRLSLGRAGSRTAEALCDAQRELLRTRPHPTFWAPFLTIGDV